MFTAIASIVAAVSIPVSADLKPALATARTTQRTFTRAIAIGCAGGSLEDVADYATPGQFMLRSRQDAIERVCAARAAIDQHATLCADRPPNAFKPATLPLAGNRPAMRLSRRWRRLPVCPGISQPADIATLVRSQRPLNVLTAGPAAHRPWRNCATWACAASAPAAPSPAPPSLPSTTPPTIC